MTEAAPTEGFWRIRIDDAAEQVVIEAPDRPVKRRGLSRSERSERAARINALAALREAAHIAQVLDESRAELDAQMQEHSARIDAATAIVTSVDRQVTVSTEPPTSTDGYPEGALWEQRDGDAVTLARWYMVGGEWVQGEILGNLIVPGTIDAARVRMDEAWADKMAANMGTFQEAFIGRLSALAIEASTFDGYTIRGAEIISPSDTGEIRLTDNTLSVGRLTEDGLQTTVSLGGGTDDEFSLTPLGSASPTVSMTGATGDAGFAGSVSVGDLILAGRPISEIIDPLPRGLIGMTWGSGASLPQIGRTSYGLVLFKHEIEAHRKYKFAADMRVEGTAGDKVEFNLHWRAAADPADLSSPILGKWWYEIPIGGTGSVHIEAPFSQPWNHANHTLLLAMRNWSAARPVCLWSDGGSAESQSYFWLEDLGLSRGASAVEWWDGGGTPYEGQTAPTPPPATKRTYTKTYTATSFRSWRGSGTVTSELGHGTYGGYKRVSQLLFPASVRSDLSGATNIRARVRLRNIHTYYGAGMTAYVSPGTQTSLASSPATTPTGSTSHWSKGDAKYVSLPGFTGSHQSVWLGIGAPGGNAYYGKFSPALGDCVLELTYDK